MASEPPLKVMRDFFGFLTAHLVPSLFLALGAIVTILAPIAGAYRIITLPLPWEMFMAMGAAVFMLAILLLLFADHQNRECKDGSTGTAPNERRKVKVITTQVETRDQKESRNRILIATRDVLAPLQASLGPPLWFTRDIFRTRFGKGKVYEAIGYGIDMTAEHARAPKIISSLDIQNPDVARTLSLHEIQAAYYNAYVRYLESTDLFVDLVEKAAPYTKHQIETLKPLVESWLKSHDAFWERIEIFKNDPELHLYTDLKVLRALKHAFDFDLLLEQPVARDASLGLALGYMLSGNWAADFFEGICQGKASQDRGLMAFDRIHQAACDGVLFIWGRESERHSWVKIEAAHWANYTFDWFSTWHSEGYQGAKDETIEDRGGSRSKYHDLMVSRSQIEKICPKGVDT